MQQYQRVTSTGETNPTYPAPTVLRAFKGWHSVETVSSAFEPARLASNRGEEWGRTNQGLQRGRDAHRDGGNDLLEVAHLGQQPE